MEINIGKLFEGKSTIIKNNEYLSTEEYVNPFIEFMKKFTNDFYVRVQLPNQFTITDSKEDITYNRVWVQAVMPIKCDKAGYAETYNLIYALDVRKPIYKLFKAYKDRKTNNLFAFNEDWLNVYELKPETQFIEFDKIITDLMQQVDNSELIFNKLKNNFLSSENEDRQRKLGELIEDSMVFETINKGGKIKIAPNMVLKAYQNVYLDSSSRNYISDSEECSMFNYVDAFSSLITEDIKDIVNQFEKNWLIYSMFLEKETDECN